MSWVETCLMLRPEAVFLGVIPKEIGSKERIWLLTDGEPYGGILAGIAKTERGFEYRGNSFPAFGISPNLETAKQMAECARNEHEYRRFIKQKENEEASICDSEVF